MRRVRSHSGLERIARSGRFESSLLLQDPTLGAIPSDGAEDILFLLKLQIFIQQWAQDGVPAGQKKKGGSYGRSKNECS